MEGPEIIDEVIPAALKSAGFWSGREPIARAIVDGFLTSAYLWIFWVPFITGVALPLNTALIKQALCRASETNYPGYIPGISNLPPSSIQSLNVLVDDNSTMYSQNTTQLVILWVCGAVWVVCCFWMANIIISAAGLNWWNVMIFNFVMAILIIIVEISFFLGVAMRFNPYNIDKVYQNILPSMNNTINKFIDAAGAPSAPSNGNIKAT